MHDFYVGLTTAPRNAAERVSDEELERYRHAMVPSFALSLESPQSLMSYVFTRVSNGFPAQYQRGGRLHAMRAHVLQRSDSF